MRLGDRPGRRRAAPGGGPGAPFLPSETRPAGAWIGNSEAGSRSPADRGQRPPAPRPAPPAFAWGVAYWMRTETTLDRALSLDRRALSIAVTAYW